MNRRRRSVPSKRRDDPTDDTKTSMRTNAATGRTTTTRRRFLRASTAVGALVGAGGVAGAQSQSKTIRLGGEIGGWKGRKPESIAGKSNPTLDLEAGTTYRLTWKNLDGRGHNFALLDSKGEVLKRTEVMNERGATQTIEFTARTEMAEYVCEPHRTSMHGSISFGKGTPTTTTTERSGSESSYFDDGPTVRTETLTKGKLTAPLDFGVPPGESGRYFIADRVGQVYAYESGSLNEKPFMDVSGKLTEITGEMGLLGMTFHPNYQKNGKFYLRYSAPRREGTPENYDHTEVLSEFTASTDGTTGKLDSERTILEIPSPYDTHNAGSVLFGPDGYLYMGMGDGGGAHDTGTGHVDDWYERFEGGNGQDVTENLLGSVLRIDVDSRKGDKAYGIPDDNPLVGRPGLDEHFAWGFRNPWRMGFSDGKLFASDVGQNGFEEIDIVQKDKNYGWNVREGTHCFKPGPEGSRNPPEECPSKLPPDVRGGERLIPPIIEYPHSVEGHGVGSAAIGGYLYGRDDIPGIQGTYIFGDFRKTKETETPTGSLLSATPSKDGGLWDVAELSIENTDSGFVGGYILAIGRDNDGRLYVLTTANPGSEATGAVHRIVPPKRSQQAGTTATGNATSDSSATPANTTATPNATATTNTTATTNAATTGNATTADTIGVGGPADATASSSSTVRETAGRTPTGGTQAGGEGGVSAGTSGESGPGFGVLAALSGLAVGAVRLLSGREN